MQTYQTDVAIVGYGPVGAIAANLLGLYGIHTAVFEREDSVYHLPRALHVDGEAMRVFQQIGLLDALKHIMTPIDKAQFLTGRGTLLFNACTVNQPYGFPAGNGFFQPDLEAVLRKGVKRFPQVVVHLAHEVEKLEQDETGVDLLIRVLSDGSCKQVRARYVLGCDGAGSIVRKAVGIHLRDWKFQQDWLVVDTLLKEEIALPTLPQQRCDPIRPTTYVPYVQHRRRWEFMLVEGEQRREMERSSNVAALLTAWGVDPDKVEIVRAAAYTFHALVAEKWRNERCFLAGDAAHQMPPFLGQGLCSGIRDVHNLCWKLRLVLQDKAASALLDSYQQERKPHVTRLVNEAIRAGRIIQMRKEFVPIRDCAIALLMRLPRRIRVWLRTDLYIPPLEAGMLTSTKQKSTRGKLFPQPYIRDSANAFCLLDDVLGPGFALLGLDLHPSCLFDETTRHYLESLSTRFIRIIPPGKVLEGDETGSVCTVKDVEGVLTDWFHHHKGTIAVLRPDRYVFGIFDAATIHTAVAELQSLCPVPRQSEPTPTANNSTILLK